MLEITLQRAGKQLIKEPVGSAPITIGRSSENTVRLLDPEISRNHCRIEWADGELRATDLSTNGILINGDLVTDAEINAGDRISIGPWTVVVDSKIDAVPVKTLISSPHSTRILSYDPVENKLATQSMEIMVTSPDQAPLKKRVAKTDIMIGHHASCEIAVADPYVSRRHARLTVEDGRVKLLDLASTNGVFVGKTRVQNVTMQSHGIFRIGRSAVHYRLLTETEKVKPSNAANLGDMTGVSKKMRELFSLIERVAPSLATIVVTGESGTGKELVAREIHRLSERKEKPFVAVNCGSIPGTIIESQLFGHERGAFTGALERMPGLFEQAKGGTLFLDEIGEMPLELQTRLLRVLEERTVRRVGGQEEIPVDVRLVCATNRDLTQMVSEGRFRDDLLFRILVVPIELPPLRDRPEDTIALARAFLSELSPDGRNNSFTDAALKRLSEYGWPGNVRELRNTIERTILLSEHDIIEACDLQFAPTGKAPIPEKGLKEQEQSYIINALSECEGNVARTARKIGVARTTLQAKMKKYGIK